MLPICLATNRDRRHLKKDGAAHVAAVLLTTQTLDHRHLHFSTTDLASVRFNATMQRATIYSKNGEIKVLILFNACQLPISLQSTSCFSKCQSAGPPLPLHLHPSPSTGDPETNPPPMAFPSSMVLISEPRVGPAHRARVSFIEGLARISFRGLPLS
jgi:hypothetical protein